MCTPDYSVFKTTKSIAVVSKHHMSTTMTIRLEPDLKRRLDQLAEATNRSKSFLAAEALRDFVELNEWQIAEIQDAIKEADAGDFASEQAVKETLNKWGFDAS